MKLRNFMNLSYPFADNRLEKDTEFARWAISLGMHARLGTWICVSLTLPAWLDHSHPILFYFRNEEKGPHELEMMNGTSRAHASRARPMCCRFQVRRACRHERTKRWKILGTMYKEQIRWRPEEERTIPGKKFRRGTLNLGWAGKRQIAGSKQLLYLHPFLFFTSKYYHIHIYNLIFFYIYI